MNWQYKTFQPVIKISKTIVVLLVTLVSSGQKPSLYNDKKKGNLAISWGWNRAAYTNSNIILKGSDYDIKLYKASAHDRPSYPVNYHNYLQFNRLTIPQTNFRASYFIKDNLAISGGDDHMKYVLDQGQTVPVKGNISRNGNYKGAYNGDIEITEDFLKFEHTDGLNYINFEIEKYFTWYHSKNSNLIISGMFGGGTGFLFPRTNVTFLDYERNDRFHISGFGLSSKAGIQATFFKHFIIKAENKYGYINLPDIILHKKGIQGRGKQGFFFAEAYVTLGASFNVLRNHKKKLNKLNCNKNNV